MKRLLLVGVVVLAAFALLSGCNLDDEIVELTLDDSWELTELKDESDIITTDLDDYITVEFDAGNNTATFDVDTEWVSTDPEGTFDFEVDASNNKILLKDSGTTEFEITYEFKEGISEMKWTKLVDVNPGDVVIVGSGSIIKYLKFERT